MVEIPGQFCIRLIEARISENRAKLEFVKNKVRRAAIAGRIEVSEQLRNAERRADSHLRTAEDRFEKMKLADAASLEAQKRDVEIACDDLAQSIKKIVARF